MNEFNHLTELPGSPQEQAWLEERLETLSVRESRILAAALMNTPPRDAREAAYCLYSLDEYEVCFPAGSYEQLGQFYLNRETKPPDSVLPYVDLEALGRQYEDKHPGLFLGNCYILYPPQPIVPLSQKGGLPLLWDGGWSVKLRLASPAVPEGVWLRLPGQDGKRIEETSEVVMVLDELKVNTLEDCTLLDARCILPEAGNLMEQYDSAIELVRDGDNLGYAMEEQGQGEPYWLERFAAALEYENCRTLKFALDISQNLHCYDWVPCEDLAISAEGLLLDAGVPPEIINSGCIDLCAYKADLLENSGYMLASGETGYILRNDREFYWEFSPNPADSGMQTMR